ncbi:hypothetical protein HK405_005181 [Cladochytrium tenue]|nr:hypothetical protein HK405_005181 [Cladochytrium tenue]
MVSQSHNLVVSPGTGRTVGAFLDTLLVNTFGVFVAAACWALVNSAAGVSNGGMATLLFVIVYVFSYIRTLSDRYFGIGIIGPLFTYLTCISAVGLSGSNTTGGNIFDSNFLLNNVCSFLIGGAISLVVNVLVFPDFAEPKLRARLGDAAAAVVDLLRATVLGSHVGDGDVIDSAEDAADARAQAATRLRGLLAELGRLAADVRSEPTWSRFSAMDLARAVDHVAAMSAQLFALEAALLNGNERTSTLLSGLHVVLAASASAGLPLDDISQSANTVTSGYCDLLEAAGSAFTRSKGADGEASAGGLGPELEEQVKSALDFLEANHFAVLFHTMYGGIEDDKGARRNAAMEGVAEANFVGVSMREFRSEVIAFYKLATDPTKKRRLRFYYPHFSPSFLASSPGPASRPAGTPKKRKTFGQIWKMANEFFFSRGSVFAIKCAIASVAYLLIGFNEPTFFTYWSFSGSFVTLLVAITPSLGQTNLALVVNLAGTCVGQLWGFVALEAWGTGPQLLTASCRGWGCNNGVQSDPWRSRVGLGLWAFILAIPMVHVYLNTRVGPLGLLALLSFSGSLIPSYLNRQNPAYDSPWVRFYKSLAALAMILTSAFVLQLSFYPNFARRNLRTGLAQAILRLNALYGHLNNVAFVSGASVTEDAGGDDGKSPSPDKTDTSPQALPASLLGAARAERLRLQAHVRGALPTLLALSRAEVRLEGPLQTAEYSEVLRRIGLLLDALNAAWISLQGKTFGGEILGMLLESEEARVNRKEMHDKTRLLCYLFSSSLITKQPLPSSLPRASPQRDLVFRTFHGLARVYLTRRYHAARHTPSFLTVSAEDSGPTAAITAPASAATPAVDAADLSAGVAVGDLGVVAEPTAEAPAESGDGYGKVDGLAEVSAPAPDSVAAFRAAVQTDVWTRLLAYSLSMRLFAAELDALAAPVSGLFGDDAVPEDALWAFAATAEAAGEDAEITTIA